MGGEVRKDITGVPGWPAETAFTIDHPLDGGPGKPQ